MWRGFGARESSGGRASLGGYIMLVKCKRVFDEAEGLVLQIIVRVGSSVQDQ